jgi:hypothetical protein
VLAGLERPWHRRPRPTRQTSSPGGCERSPTQFPIAARLPVVEPGLDAVVETSTLPVRTAEVITTILTAAEAE